MKPTLLLICAFAIASLGTARAAELATFAAAEKEAVRLYGTHEGHTYRVKFLDAMDQAVGQALQACLPSFPVRTKDIRFEIVFIVSAEGRIERMLRSSDSRSAVCFMKSIRPPAEVPRPPRDQWPIVTAFTIGPLMSSNQAMQLTASKPAIYAGGVCRRAPMLRGTHRGVAAADLVSR